MSFWTDATLSDPKRAFRFRVSLGADGFGGVLFYAKKVTRPKFTQTEVKHAYLNYEFHFPGRVQWEPCTITVVDPTQPDVAYFVSKLVEAGGYRIPANPNSYTTIGKNSSVAAMNNVTIEQIGANGNALETWKLKNAWLKDPQFSDLDYESDELSTIDLVIRFDWAELTGLEGNRVYVPSGDENGNLLE